ncbi:unnamed protein product, partial [Mesorhabditis spiculigera]
MADEAEAQPMEVQDVKAERDEEAIPPAADDERAAESAPADTDGELKEEPQPPQDADSTTTKDQESASQPAVAVVAAAAQAPPIPTRQYLDHTVVPILMEGLGALAKARPQDPVKFLAEFLIREKPRFAPSVPVSN